MKRWIINVSLLFASIIVSVLLIEFISRLIFPVEKGVHILNMNGEKIQGAQSDMPGLRYRAKSSDYDAVTTITDLGYRIPEVNGNPDIIFIGDSFTFGLGVNDEDTFVYQYCNALKLSCANLGLIATGTISQVNRLEKYLVEQNWKPKEVKLFMLAMTRFLSHGNDLSDNLRDASSKPKQINSLFTYLLSQRNKIVKNSNLLRIIYYFWGVELRTLFSTKSKEELVNKALEITRKQLIRLDELSHNYGFKYEIFLVHPMQDITWNTFTETHKKIQTISPVPVHSTGHLFVINTKNYYYNHDGHLNVNGNREIAEFLLSNFSK